eukprot:Em0020g451a
MYLDKCIIVKPIACTFQGNCSVLHHVFIQNGTHGIVVAIAAGTTAGRNSNAASRAVPGVQLPAECGPPTYAQCNTTVVYYYPGDGNLTLLIPVVGGVLILTYYYDPGAGWSPTPTEPCVLKVLGNCNPIAVGHIQDSTLSVLCLDLSPSGSHFGTLLLTLDPTDACQSSLAEIGTYNLDWLPSLSNPVLVQVLANCPQLSVVTAVVVFADGNGVYMASMSQTAPQPFLKVSLSGETCPTTGPSLEYYGEDTFLLRCSAGEALTFDPCHQALPHVTNHSLSVPYPCSASGVVAWMYPANNSIVVRFENGTVTQPIVLGSVSEASCVNAKDPQFVYRHANGSVYVVRIQDGHVTTLGTSVCSMPPSSPALCSGLDFTEHEGSFFVGFFDGLTYKMANLSCPGEAPAVVGVAFRPDLSTSFVGPDEQRCLCFPQAPTLPPSPSSSLSAVIIGATSASAIGVAAAGVVILIVVLRKKCKAQYDSLPTQPEGNEEPQQETEECSNRNGATDLENHRVNAPAFPESREQHNHSALAMSNDPLLPNTSTNHDFA